MPACVAENYRDPLAEESNPTWPVRKVVKDLTRETERSTTATGGHIAPNLRAYGCRFKPYPRSHPSPNLGTASEPLRCFAATTWASAA